MDEKSRKGNKVVVNVTHSTEYYAAQKEGFFAEHPNEVWPFEENTRLGLKTSQHVRFVSLPNSCSLMEPYDLKTWPMQPSWKTDN